MKRQENSIQILGASEHNLKSVNVTIPRAQFVVITGVSGSGKSSLAFDTIFAEGQRKYMESLSSYARQFLNQMDKPDVESIEGLPPTIAIAQRSNSHNPRSTVATTTEIYDYLRLLMARCGTPRCWHKEKDGSICDLPIESTTITQIIDAIMKIKSGVKIMICAPVIVGRKGFHRDVLEELRADGFVRVRVDGKVVDLREALINEDENPLQLGRYELHHIEAIVDRITTGKNQRDRISDSVETAARLSGGVILVLVETKEGWEEQRFSEQFTCSEHSTSSLPELEPRLFSFNSHFGACTTCDGLGVVHEFDCELIVPDQQLPINKAVVPWRAAGPAMRRKYGRNIRKFCDMAGVDTTSPFKSLQEDQVKLLFQGGSLEGSRLRFKGVIPELRRRFKQTESDNVRNWLFNFMTDMTCPECCGERLRPEARSVTVQTDQGDRAINVLTSLTILDLLSEIKTIKLDKEKKVIAEPILREIECRLTFMVSVGLDYLSLNRTSSTLSGGESQRIRLATQVGSGLVGVCYVLDEPTIGLHARDNQRLLKTLLHLVDIGNTVIVVEHDEAIIRAAEHLIDVGPAAGRHGGEIVAQGTVKQIESCRNSVTGQYLSGKKEIATPSTRRNSNLVTGIQIRCARHNNLQDINVQIPLQNLVCITGVSGSGKSSLMNHVLLKGVKNQLQQKSVPASLCDEISQYEDIERVIEVDQSPIGRTPRSNPATYTGIFDGIRNLFYADKRIENPRV